MEVRLLVTLQIDPDDDADATPTVEQMQASAQQAVRNALEFANDNGFDHELGYVTSIGVVDVEIANKDADSATTKDVIVTVEGGVIQDMQVPSGVKVVVNDYDIDGADQESLSKDDNGDERVVSIWEAED